MGAIGQLTAMKSYGRHQGCYFVTVVMDAKTRAAEVYQLSNVCIQMMAEGLFLPISYTPTPPPNDQQLLTTRHCVLVDSMETQQVDPLLCLINTPVVRHIGRYTGSATCGVPRNPLRTSGNRPSLSLTTKQKLLECLQNCRPQDGNGIMDMSNLVGELCHFKILVYLDQCLSQSHMEELYGMVRKYARGQRKGLFLGKKLWLQLQLEFTK